MFIVAYFHRIGDEVVVQEVPWTSEQAFYESLNRNLTLIVYLH